MLQDHESGLNTSSKSLSGTTTQQQEDSVVGGVSASFGGLSPSNVVTRKQKSDLLTQSQRVRSRLLVSESIGEEPALVTPLLRTEALSQRKFDSKRTISPRNDGRHEDQETISSSTAVCCGIKYKHPQVGTWQYQTYLTYLTLGVIFGDIGTSPLYMFSTVFTEAPKESDVLGVLSLVIWTMILMIPVKYLTFILMASDHGEGGTFALLSLLKRGIHEKFKDKKTIARWESFLTIITLLGIGCVMADGVLTPAVSVLGAVSGLSIASPSVTSSVVVGVSSAILVLFFAFQRFGTDRVSFLFSPIMVLWFIALFGIGVYNITLYPGVLQAFSPVWGFNYFFAYGPSSFSVLGGVFLTVTGGEALYADIGHFNVKAVRVSSAIPVLPALLVCYCGQAAQLILHPEIFTNVFYLSTPNALFYPMLILATFASIIASQAMVSAAFSIFAQGIRLTYIPKLTTIHTNPKEFGQIYMPEVNFFLFVFVLIVVVGFQNATALGYAYGITVSFAFFTTTFLFSFIIYFTFKRHVIFAILFFLFFGFIDFAFFAANLLKFTNGGWFSIVMMLIIFILLLVWRWGRVLMIEKQATMNLKENDLYYHRQREVSSQTEGLITTVSSVDDPIELPNCNLMICYSSNIDSIPASFVHFLKRLYVKPKHLVFVTVSAVNVPYVEENIEIKTIQTMVYRAIIRYGYAQPPTPAIKVNQLISEEIQCAPASYAYFPRREDDLMVAVNPTFITGHDRVIPKPESRFLRRQLVELFSFLQSFSRSPVTSLAIPDENNIEIGVIIPI